MKINQKLGLRFHTQSARVRIHVVEGEGMPNPGRIRTLRIDHNIEAPEWLSLQWAKNEQKRRSNLTAAHLTQDKIDRGCFFLREEYGTLKDPLKSKGYDIFCDWQKAIEGGQTKKKLPDKYLPPRVVQLRRLAKKRPDTWEPPALAEAPARREGQGDA